MEQYKKWILTNYKNSEIIGYFNPNNMKINYFYLDNYDPSDLTHIHHIFLGSEYPQFRDFFENITLLTPTMHLNYAHRHGNTKTIDRKWCYIFLVSKVECMKKSFNLKNNIFSFKSFIQLLSTVLNNNQFLSIKDKDFDSLILLLKKIFQMNIIHKNNIQL